MGMQWTKGMSLLREAAARLSLRRDRGPVDTVAGLAGFVSTRAAFVTQKKLYGYLKARMGTRYPSMFEDEVFVQSINVAKLHVFAACLSDLSIHTVARVVAAGHLARDEAPALARHCFEAGIGDNAAHLPEPEVVEGWRERFRKRAEDVHWENMAAGGESFTESPKALYRWAPIADQLKVHDREIVENSIRFAFGEVTRDFRGRSRPAEIAADWRERKGAL
ncbi:hypothetical protein [Nitratireductor sp. ZSWI3]|uniref:hypothetical protein n=1 Tax=Nitratireductor sp. ZSWI3 TaxID=2966359 RepID=UPI0021505E13|nr:hypothetical protein [Nitratireductor sp. ZSWI3]MCR4267626.1 hypothetical protein [Nitratireductor sp. ZSWI3]